MSFNQVFLSVMAVFFVIGALDRCFGNRLGLGSEFEKGFSILGTIALTVTGLICISPVLAKVLSPVVVPVYTAIGADPAMFAPTFLSTDSGGYSIAAELAINPEIGLYAGLVVASMIGGVISFTIPVAVSLMEVKDVKYFAVGIMAGMVTSPIGCFIGGLVAGLSPSVILINLFPVLVVAALIAAGLLLIPYKMIEFFKALALLIKIVITAGLSLGALEKLTGIVILEDMNPIADGLLIASSVAVVIAGVFPFIRVFMKLFDKPIKRISEAAGLDSLSVVGMFLCLAAIVPVFPTYKNMNTKGKVLVAAFAGSMANMLGAHLGFITTVTTDMILPMFSAKIVAGFLALPFAALLAKQVFLKKEKECIDKLESTTV
jgi:ethanolamine transporter